MDPTPRGAPRATPQARTAPQHLVPPNSRLTGHWDRSLLQSADGRRDTTTEVTWLQAGELYVDLRLVVPEPRLDAHAPTCLRDLDRDQATALAQAEGFAGRLLADGPFAHWQRLVDLQPEGPHPDQGRLVDEGDRLVETGRDGSYVEHWHRATGPATPLAALLLRELATGALAVLVRVGDDVGWARGRTPGVDLLDTEVALGRVEAHGATLTRSNLPWRVGSPLAMAAVGEQVSTDDVAPDGSAVRHIWQVLSREGELADIPFRTLQETRP